MRHPNIVAINVFLVFSNALQGSFEISYGVWSELFFNQHFNLFAINDCRLLKIFSIFSTSKPGRLIMNSTLNYNIFMNGRYLSCWLYSISSYSITKIIFHHFLLLNEKHLNFTLHTQII